MPTTRVIAIQPINHMRCFLLTCITCGLYLPIWIGKVWMRKFDR